jgi:ABC-2 type transport system ATP-binding protein
MNILEVRRVTKRYGDYTALSEVSIEVKKNAVFGLLGPNGAGKTSLIRIINQITAPDSGEVLFAGEPLTAKHVERIGYLPEERGLYRKMKVGEQALYLARLKGLDRNTALSRLKYWFEKFEIDSWWNKKVEELSKGMQQKLQFIVTVIHEPDFLIFDEPFSGFDPINVNLLKQEMLALKQQGTTIIFSTHNMVSVEELCDDIALINKSEKILEGNINEIKKQHKENIFQVQYIANDTDLQQILPDSTEITAVDCPHGTHWEVRIKIPQAMTSNDLIQLLIPHIQLCGFQEIYPSMNDIFIKSVTKK